MSKFDDPDYLNPLEVNDPAELEVRRELKRRGIENEPYPENDRCPQCGSELESASGFAGELLLFCAAKDCTYAWEDSEGAIRSVF